MSLTSSQVTLRHRYHPEPRLHPNTSYRSRRGRTSHVLPVLLLSVMTLLGISSLSSSHILLLVEAKSQLQSSQGLPVVGILSQPSKKHDHSYHYIATSYVDWIEGGDHHSPNDDDDDVTPQQAITLPIPYDASPELLDELFAQINGLLLPGGWNGYMPPSVPYLLDKIVESNENGIYFPVWGTCLGYEFLIKYVGGVEAIQTGFDLYNTSIPLESVRVQELYNDPTIYETVTNFPVTLNNHQLGIEPDHFLSNPKLTAVWNITSINYDVNDRPFVSSIEPKYPMEFPFYGVQYHPEKNAYEYTTYPDTTIPYENIDHTPEGIEFSYAMSNFFLEKVRYGMQQQQQQGYSTYTNRNRFPPIRSYTSSIGTKFEEIYIIPYASHWMTVSSSSYHNNHTTATATSSQAIINISKSGMIDLDANHHQHADDTIIHYNPKAQELQLVPVSDHPTMTSSRSSSLAAASSSSSSLLIQQSVVSSSA